MKNWMLGVEGKTKKKLSFGYSKKYINFFLDRGVEGHWNHPYNRPWATIDELVKEPLANLVGK